ncbi:MAG: carboxypeptidase-like regulatory domain-containing protein [Bacteroidota bacterium]
MKTIFLFLILVLTVFSVHAQTRNIYGTVADKKTGESIPYAMIASSDHSYSAVSDVHGVFTLAIPIEKDTLEITFVGYEKSIVCLSAKSDTVAVLMESAAVMMDLIEVREVSEDASVVSPSYSYYDYDASSSDYSRAMSKSYTGTYYRSTAYENTGIISGSLTAGEVNDFQKWKLWGDIAANELKSYRSVWNIIPEQRYLLQLVNKNKMPVTDAKVILTEKNGNVLWEAHTDNTGKAELWVSLFDDGVERENLSIKVKYKGNSYSLDKVVSFQDGVNILEIPVDCNEQKVVDIAFVVDATGSMSDELEYLKVELADVISKVKDTLPNAIINLASVFYRDISDIYVTKFQDFTDNIDDAVLFIKQQSAGGGGDFPEAVDSALSVTLSQLSWSEEAASRLVFIILDAPPHSERPKVIANLQELIPKFAGKGIRVIPVTCSGIDKSTEYFLRSMALATNGTYVFLTDDSGIGSSHIKPTTDKYDVELLNAALIRIISAFSKQQECKPLLIQEFDCINVDTGIVNMPLPDSLSAGRIDSLGSDSNATRINPSSFSWKYFPNPTNGPVTIEIFNLPDNSQGELYFTDITGKVLRRFELSEAKTITTDISEFPTGTYLLRLLYDTDKWLVGKIVLLH